MRSALSSAPKKAKLRPIGSGWVIMSDKLVFKSKVDAWLGGLLGVQGIALAGVGLALLVYGPGGRISIVMAAVLLAGATLVASTLAWTQYSFDDVTLVVRSGPFAWRVPIWEVTGVKPMNQMLSGPALSRDRLQIDYGEDRSILVSPADKQGFLAALEARRGSLQDV
jgi:hypothetical protein